MCSILRGVARRDIGRFGRRLPEADRRARDPGRRRRVGFEQRRRNGQRAGDVVKASRRIVRRQQRRDVDLQIQQVADRVGVFGPVQTMQHDRAGIGGCAAALRSISASSQSRSPSYSAKRRPRHARRRHHAGAQFADHLFPHFRVIADGREIHFLKREIGRSWFCRCGRLRSTDRAARARTRPSPERFGQSGSRTSPHYRAGVFFSLFVNAHNASAAHPFALEIIFEPLFSSMIQWDYRSKSTRPHACAWLFDRRTATVKERT